LLQVTAADDELVRRLVASGSLALGRLTPRGHRVTAARGAALAATMRVVDRVHGHAAIDRLLAEPAVATGLANRSVGVVLVRDGTHGRKARTMHAALLARIEAQDRPAGVAAHILGVSAGGTRDLA